MITLTSSTQSPEEMQAALEQHGLSVVSDGPTVAADPKEEKVMPSEDPASPGDSPSGPEAETAPATEAGKEKPQVVQEPPKPVEAKFETRRKQLERQVARLHEDLDLEKGSKAALQAKLDAAQSEIAKFKPIETPKVAELVRPKRPTLAEAEWDNEKHEQLMIAYEAQLDEFKDKQYEQKLAQSRADDAKRREDETVAAEEAKKIEAFNGRLVADKEEIPDYDDLLDSIKETGLELPAAVRAAVVDSDHPGRLFHYFMVDQLEGDSKEFNRIAKMDPVQQVKALTKLEIQLDAEYTKGKPTDKPAESIKPAKAIPVAETPLAQVPEKTAKPKTPSRAQVDDPIEPVGSRAGASLPSLDKAKGLMEYIAARRQGVNRGSSAALTP